VFIPPTPHSWDLAPVDAVALQRELAAKVVLRPFYGLPVLVAGCDAAFLDDPPRCVAGVVVWDRRRREVIEEETHIEPLEFPYVPGLLSFREAPALLGALRRLRREPDVFLADGQGLAHPRRFGLACHLGVLLGRPAVGVGKSRLIGEHRDPGHRRGASVALRHEGEVVGRVLRTQDGVKPVYVSPGHLMDLKSAERVVLAAAVRFRLPEPTRLADGLVARVKAAAATRGRQTP
jgi:deoxyribonuclease V